jgi:hypothetical protein
MQNAALASVRAATDKGVLLFRSRAYYGHPLAGGSLATGLELLWNDGIFFGWSAPSR